MSPREREFRRLESPKVPGLILDRRPQEQIIINPDSDSPILITILSIQRNRVKLHIASKLKDKFKRAEIVPEEKLRQIINALSRQKTS